MSERPILPPGPRWFTDAEVAARGMCAARHQCPRVQGKCAEPVCIADGAYGALARGATDALRQAHRLIGGG